MAIAGLGLVKLPLCDVMHELESGQLVQAAPQIELPSFKLFVVTLKQLHQPIKITKAVELISRHYNEHFSLRLERAIKQTELGKKSA